MKSETRGSALLIAVGMLMILFSLALAYSFQTRAEHKSAESTRYKTRARFLASSGLEKILGENLSNLATGTAPLYRGEDWNGNQENSVVPENGQTEDWNGNNNGRLDRTNLPVDHALSPSLYVDENNDHKPDLITIKRGGVEKKRGYSGRLPSTAPDGSDTYSLKIIDNSTRININSRNRNLPKILSLLYQHKRNFRKKKPSETKPPGRKIVKYRNKLGGQFKKLEQLKKILSERMYDFLAPHLVIGSNTWVNPSVIKPNPQRLQTFSLPTANGESYQNINGPKTFDFQYQKQPRAPVNLNRTPVFVLSSLIQGLKARALKSKLLRSDTKQGLNQSPNLQTERIGPIPKKQALIAAQKMVKYREGDCTISLRGEKESGPFETWMEFDQFVDQALITNNADCKIDSTDTTGKQSAFKKEWGYLLKANFNPNTRFSKWNPNKTARLSWTKETPEGTFQLFLDKTDFLYHTTEFSFFSTGYFEIRSLGRVVSSNHELLSSARLQAVIHPFRIARHKSQRDFLLNRTNSTQKPGGNPGASNNDPTFLSYPENARDRMVQKQIKTGEMSTPSLAGRIAVAPKTHALPPSKSDIHLPFQYPDPSYGDGGSPTFIQEMKMDNPESWNGQGKMAKDYYAAPAPGSPSNQSPSSGSGVTGGKILEDQISRYPEKDFRGFSDLLPDGLLLSSSRARFIRYNLEQQDSFWWLDGGVISFWWKPREDLSALQGRKRHIEIELFEGWYLAEQMNVRVPTYQDAFFGNMQDTPINNNQFYPTIGDPEDDSHGLKTTFQERKIPRYLSKHFSFSADNQNAAGYRIRFYYTTKPRPGYYMDVSFELFSAQDDLSTPSDLPEGPNTNQTDLVIGKVQTRLPVQHQKHLIPDSGEWTRVVMKWSPEIWNDGPTNELRFLRDKGGAIDNRFVNGIETYAPEVKLLTGRFWIDGTKSSSINPDKQIWAGQVKKSSLHSSQQNIPNVNIEQELLHLNALRPYNLILTEHIFQEQNKHNDWQLFHDETFSPGQIWLQVKHPREVLSNVFWIGGSTRPSLTSSTPPQTYYAEGTIDEFHLSRNEAPIDTHREASSRYPDITGRKPIYQGSFFRKNNHPDHLQKSTDVPDHSIFQTDPRNAIEVILLAHTQYSPTETPQNQMSMQDSPYFQIDIGMGQENQIIGRPRNWRGSPKNPQELLGTKLILSPDKRRINYQVLPREMSNSPQNTTPFLEDFTILYKNQEQNNILSLEYIPQ